MEISLKEIFSYLKKWLALILTVAILAGAGAFLFTEYFVEPVYSSRVKFYASGDEQNSNSNFSYYKSVTPQFIEFLNVTEYFSLVAQKYEEIAGEPLSPYVVGEAISFSDVVSGTSAFYVTVHSESSVKAYNIARAVAQTAPSRVESFENAGTLEIISDPALTEEPVSPSVWKNTAIGFLLGLFLMAGIVILREMLDSRIRTPEEITELFGFPVFGVVPDFGEHGRKGASK